MNKLRINILRIGFLILLILGMASLVALDLETWLMVNLEATKIPIFGFHNIVATTGENNRDGLAYTEENLKKFLEYLVREDYWFLDSNDLYNYFLTKSLPIPRDRLGKKPIMLTFDDGYKSIDTIILPILQRLENKYNQRVKVVLFVNPVVINNPNRAKKYLTCEELRKGAIANYYDIQSHGFSHKKLTNFSDEKLAFELETAQKRLKECTENIALNETAASHLAYPFNDSNSLVESYTARYYLSGYLYNDQILKLGWIKNNYQIPRVAVYRNRKLDEMIKLAEFSTKTTARDRRFLGKNNFHLLLEFL